MTEATSSSRHIVAGSVLTLPVRVRRAQQHTAMFVVDADGAQAMIDYSGLRVCRFATNRALVVLMLMHYEDTDLGRYYEYGTNVMVNPPGASAGGIRALRSAGAFVHHLPVDQTFTLEAGRTIWGYPKVMAEFTVRGADSSAGVRGADSSAGVRGADSSAGVRGADSSAGVRGGRRFGFDVTIDGQLVVGMEFRSGLRVPARFASRPRVHSTYSCLNGVVRETPGRMVMTGVRYRPGGVTVRLGQHPYAAELAALGLPRHAMVSSSAVNVDMTFGDARVVA